ncbi:MAG TPA: Fe-Mn family superoxide dismutase [Nitrospira sp.]|nr:Fe-Mn family superoxide dismutase [Nitrospira sp.]
MLNDQPYQTKSFNLRGLQGISDKTVNLHLSLYEGYVKATNMLQGKITEFLKDGIVDQEELPAYSELTRRLGFEYNGMVLHEYYFDNLTPQASVKPESTSSFLRRAEASFGSYERWKTDFVSVGKMRGVGWAVCLQDPASGRITNHWITLHEHGIVAGFKPVLVMDAWEHAFLLDYTPAQRGQYIEAFFSNVNWRNVDRRVEGDVSHLPRAA